MRNHFLKTKKKEKTGKRKSNDLKLCVTAAAAANKNTSSVESFRKINQWILNDFSYKIYEDWLKIVFFFFYRLEIAQNPSNDKSVGCSTVITLRSNELPVQSGALKCLMITREKLNQERKKMESYELLHNFTVASAKPKCQTKFISYFVAYCNYEMQEIKW